MNVMTFKGVDAVNQLVSDYLQNIMSKIIIFPTSWKAAWLEMHHFQATETDTLLFWLESQQKCSRSLGEDVGLGNQL